MYLTQARFRSILEQHDVDIYTFISDRKGRKTSTVQIELIDRALEHNQPFILIRSKKDEYISASWFSEYTQEYYQKKKIHFITEKINGNIVRVSAIREGEQKQKTIFFGVWLSLAEKYKSNYYDGFARVRFIVWEECVPNHPIPQNINNVLSNHMQKMTDILSIASTIVRNNKVKFIFLGNDISKNIINPVTVAFNLLERLEANCEIVDTVDIDDRRYSFYFNYFDFPDAVNHWLVNKNENISNDVDVSSLEPYSYIIKSAFKSYYLYNIGNAFYISTQGKKVKREFIGNTKEFFEYYGHLDLYKKYSDDISVALMILYTYEKRLQEPIRRYFGCPEMPKFTPQKNSYSHSIIPLYELREMSYSDILNLTNIDDIRNFVRILKKGVIIYENAQVKILCEALKGKMIFDDVA